MKRVCLMLAAGLLLSGGSVVRAAEEGTMSGALNLAAPAEPSCAAPSCADCGHCGRSRSFCDWLLYKPPSCHCCCCVVSTCYPPLHTWFLDMCRARCGRTGCGPSCSAGWAPCTSPACKGPGVTAPDAAHQP